MVKGRAKATEKASIVTIGVQNSPWVDLMRTEPTMGPVQEKDTSTRVRAMKNTPARPFLLEFASLLFCQEEGSTISNAPKKEAAKTMNTRKKMRFGSQCVASQLKMSAVTVSPPRRRVRPMMTLMGTVYSRTMNRPYMKALNRPWCAFSDPFRKNETVIGIIGNTQGVRSIAKPQRMASMMRAHRPPRSFASSGLPMAVWCSAASAGPTATLKAYSSGNPHMSSVQACQVMAPSTVLPESTVTSCEKTALSKKTRSSLYACGLVTSCSGPAVTGVE